MSKFFTALLIMFERPTQLFW